jgi:hypothetical protein
MLYPLKEQCSSGPRKECEALGFSGALVAHQVYVNYLGVPAKGQELAKSPCRRNSMRRGGEGNRGRHAVRGARACNLLHEDDNEVTLSEVVGDAADEDVGGVHELGMPRRVLPDAEEHLLLVDHLGPLHLCQGIHRHRRLRSICSKRSGGIEGSVEEARGCTV